MNEPRWLTESQVTRIHHEQLVILAADYGFGLAKNNPFVDENKRAALAAVKRSNDSHSRQIAVSLVVAGKLVREVERTID